jgi:hypothetical protein
LKYTRKVSEFALRNLTMIQVKIQIHTVSRSAHKM